MYLVSARRFAVPEGAPLAKVAVGALTAFRSVSDILDLDNVRCV